MNRSWIVACTIVSTLATFMCQAQTPPQALAPPQGSLSLYGSDTIGHVFTPGEEWGRPMEYDLRAYRSPIGEHKAQYITFLNLPSATTVFLSSDANCAKNEHVDFWIALSATRESTFPEDQSQLLPIRSLLSTGQNESLGGLRVEGKHIKVPNTNLDKLSCVRITTSRRPGQQVPTVPLVVSVARHSVQYTDYEKCPGTNDSVLAGRGIEKKPHDYETYIDCASNGQIKLEDAVQAYKAPWENTVNACPINSIMTGLIISPGSSPLKTAYYSEIYCAYPKQNDQNARPLWVQPDDHFETVGHRTNHAFRCPNDKVIVAIRSEDNQIGYRCATLLSYPSNTVQPSLKAPGEDTGKITFFDTRPGQEQLYPYNFGNYGTSQQYEFVNYQSGLPVQGEGDVPPIEQFRLENVASATVISLSSDALCRTNGDFAITLRSTRNNARTSTVNITDLFKGTEGSPLESGFELVSKHGNSANKTLRCMRVEVSRKPGQSVPHTPLPVSGTWRPSVPENHHDFTCPDSIMTGRSHVGDENEPTSYACAHSPALVLTPVASLEGIKESAGIWAMCPFDTVMVGRKHIGDENAATTYRCAQAFQDGKALSVRPVPAWAYTVEDDHRFSCPDGGVLVGRWHVGDTESDNSDQHHTAYRCATLLR